jgi:cytochrome c2
MLDLALAEQAAKQKIADVPARKAAINAEFKRRESKLPEDATEEMTDALAAEKAAALAAVNAEAEGLAQSLAAVATARGVREQRESELYQEMKKVGPNLKEIALKLKPEWLPVWLSDPAAFRPDTKMPSFVLTKNQRDAISAYVWAQSSKLKDAGVAAPKRDKGDVAVGAKLFVSRGCTACHSVGTGKDKTGGDFAADLSRLGEKANYDYVVHWVQHPRTRLAPYSLDRKRDLVPADYAAKGLPYAFPETGGRDPETGGRLVAHNYTVMPDFRLSDSDARDIATYLLTLKTDADYEAVDWMTAPSPELLKEGEKWTKHFGCAGCHEIPGLESEQRIGTELTVEGSKPIERLDFGLLTHEAMHPRHPHDETDRKVQRELHPYPPADADAEPAPWYTHKGFFMGKLKNPQMYDHGKLRGVEDTAALKMPNFRFDDADRVAMTTFLLGSVETSPRLKDAGYFNLPAGKKKAIQEGWWVIKKYNCQGCHQVEPGETPDVWTQTWFASKSVQEWTAASGEVFKNGATMRPPSLVGQGFRTDPQWLADFLRNPPQSTTDLHRNGVRSYLNVRMPTFHLSEGEIQKLVAFFGALSDQPTPFVRPVVEPLAPNELAAVREYFPKCATCHAKGEAFDPLATAPSFSLTPSRLNPSWVARWIQDPQSFAPGTKMPVWFKEEADGTWHTDPAKDSGSPLFNALKVDHIDLLRRYLGRYNEYEPTPEKN